MLRITDRVVDLPEFINFVSAKKRELGDWSFSHFQATEDLNFNLSEIIQYLHYHFQGAGELWAHMRAESKDFVIVTHNQNNLELTKFNKAILENFPPHSFRVTTSSFKEGRINQFAQILSEMIPEGDTISSIGVKRLGRLANTIMVLDDDLMILKQIEKGLGTFGRVVTINNHKDFLETYKVYAPNILYLDVHLEQVKGPNILSMFFEKIDPYAHVVIISSDQKKETVQSIASKGVKGYIVKPFSQQQLFEHLLKAETFVPKTH